MPTILTIIALVALAVFLALWASGNLSKFTGAIATAFAAIVAAWDWIEMAVKGLFG